MNRVIHVCLAIVICTSFAYGSANSATWQQSFSQQAELGIRDKFGDAGGYIADFIVTDPNGKQYSKKIRVEDADYGIVLFPKDFGMDLMIAGKYQWKAKVNGKDVIKGQFKYEIGDNSSSLSYSP